jgi:hypothetical protein
MDFYVPRREDRRTWRGTADVGVYATVEEDDAQVQGYTVGGQRLLLAEGRAAAGVAVLLAPAEPKGRRVDPQPVGPGEVIEDATDGTRSGSIGHRGPDGEWLETDLADWVERRPASTAAAGQRGSGHPMLNVVSGVTTYLVSFEPRFFDGYGFQDCEIRYTLTHHRSDGTVLGERRYTDYSVPCPQGTVVEKDYRNASLPYGYALAPFEPLDGSGEYLKLSITEIDEWVHDNYGATLWKLGEELTEHCKPDWCAVLNW